MAELQLTDEEKKAKLLMFLDMTRRNGYIDVKPILDELEQMGEDVSTLRAFWLQRKTPRE